jgi:hypothetical protein
MRRMLVGATAFAAVLLTMPAALATPAAPAPTVSITTALGGQALPVASMTGSWTVQKPGRRASLTVSGVAATGTSTTIRSTWVSTLRRGIGIKFLVGGDFATLLPGTSKDGLIVRVDFRGRHGRWQDSGAATFDHGSQPLDNGDQGIGAFIAFLHPAVVQWRVRVVATYDDTSRQSFRETVQAV